MNTRSTARGAVLVITAAVLALSACSSSSPSKPATSPSVSGGIGPLAGSITVFAASSLQGTFTTLAADFKKLHPKTKITFNFGSSGDLAASITSGTPADVFASASPSDMTTVTKADDANAPVNFVKNTAEIATPPTNPAHITKLADLGKPGVKLATCVVTAPCGVLAQSILSKASITTKPTASEPDVKSTLAIVETGNVDAGIVYVTDVMAAGKAVHGVPIPTAQNGTTEYPIATLVNAPDPIVASAFMAYVLSPTGTAVLKAAGFESP